MKKIYWSAERIREKSTTKPELKIPALLKKAARI
jgi:hypothetical protein